MDPEHGRWLRTLIAACDDAAAKIRGRGDPSSRRLLADIEDLRARLKAELQGEDRTSRHS
jgi:hypothetical protein